MRMHITSLSQTKRPRSSTQGCVTPLLSYNKRRVLFQTSIFLWQQYDRCRAIRFCQHPNPVTGAGGIRRQNTKPLLDCYLILVLVFLWHVSPITVNVPIQKLCRELLGLLKGTECPGSCHHVP
jgi:hypothetical protein